MAWVTKTTSLSKRTGYFYEGREIALTKYVGMPPKLPRHNGNWWPEEKKLEAATIYAVTKSWEAVRDLVGMPIHAAKKFSEEPWWDSVVSKVKKEKNELLDAKITEVLETSLTVVKDRLDNGEYVFDRKTKELDRVPVRMRDAAYTAETLFDKRQLLRGEATTNTGALSSDQKLLALKEQFERLAVSKGINPKSETIEGEVIRVSTERENQEQTPESGQPEVREGASSEGEEVNEAGDISPITAPAFERWKVKDEARRVEQQAEQASQAEIVTPFKAIPA